MKSRSPALALAFVAVGLFAAQPVTAQAPFQDQFSFMGLVDQPNQPVTSGVYGGPYLGAFGASPSSSSSFFIWCIDFSNRIRNGDSYEAWITPMDGNDFSNTRGGASNANNYRWTAFLAGQMNWMSNPTAANKTKDAQVNEAMWALMGKGNRVTTLTNFFVTYGAALGLTSYGSDWFDDAAPETDWAIITCDPGDQQSCGFQEFIYVPPSTPTEIVPEPATMTLLATGLAGMIGANVRKRRKRA